MQVARFALWPPSKLPNWRGVSRGVACWVCKCRGTLSCHVAHWSDSWRACAQWQMLMSSRAFAINSSEITFNRPMKFSARAFIMQLGTINLREGVKGVLLNIDEAGLHSSKGSKYSMKYKYTNRLGWQPHSCSPLCPSFSLPPCLIKRIRLHFSITLLVYIPIDISKLHWLFHLSERIANLMASKCVADLSSKRRRQEPEEKLSMQLAFRDGSSLWNREGERERTGNW